MNDDKPDSLSISNEGRMYLRATRYISLTAAALLFLSWISVSSCQRASDTIGSEESPANLQHVLSLVDSLQVAGQTLMYIRIYADYPSYEPVGAPGEGIACVDDAGRLMEVLEIEILQFERLDLIPIARGITRFLLHLQRGDGLWYNFIFADGTINTAHRNSAAGFGWWAARGLRGLAAAYSIFKQSDTTLADTILARFRLSESHLNANLAYYPGMKLTAHGLRAGWLPNEAPDQSSEFLLALAKMHHVSPLNYSNEIRILANGILTCQYQNPEAVIDGMLFCWNNVWHNWGNLQALAILEAYAIDQDSTYLNAVERWADHFLTWTAGQGHFWEITATTAGDVTTVEFPQIAYGLGSSYKGISRLAAITQKPAHETLAEQFIGWFNGNNRANQVMYDSTTGRCYDGIDSPDVINRNSGAESTIEALLALQFASLPRQFP